MIEIKVLALCGSEGVDLPLYDVEDDADATDFVINYPGRTRNSSLRFKTRAEADMIARALNEVFDAGRKARSEEILRLLHGKDIS